MKIINSKQSRWVDEETMKNEPISSIDLMERAGGRCTEKICDYIDIEEKVIVICGTGNNGGDGLVIARLLHQKGYAVQCFVIRYSTNFSKENLINQERLNECGAYFKFIDKVEDLSLVNGSVYIDALFGAGLSRPVEGFASEVIHWMNANANTIISIDISSGLFDEDNRVNVGAIIEADVTIPIQQPKLSLLLESNVQYVGKWESVDIGLDQTAINQCESRVYFHTMNDFSLKERAKFSHKGTYGHVHLYAGSLGKMGAAILSARAALRSGTGLVTGHIPSVGLQPLQAAFPEAMVQLNHGKDKIEYFGEVPDGTVVIGPGLGQDEITAKELIAFLHKQNNPVVLDADALNNIALNKEALNFIPENSILTPHPKEFSRLAGSWERDEDLLELLKQFTSTYKVIIVFKRAHTIIALPNGNLFFNSTGNPGMATAGSGDVLTGIIGGLLAQNYDPSIAARLGVFIHGLAADIYVENHSMESLIASDIIECLPQAFQILLQ